MVVGVAWGGLQCAGGVSATSTSFHDTDLVVEASAPGGARRGGGECRRRAAVPTS